MARPRLDDSTRDNILDAVDRLLGRYGYGKMSIADVAREAGVSQQTVVNHFGSKEDLYLVGVRERWAPAVNEVRSRVAPASLLASARLCLDARAR